MGEVSGVGVRLQTSMTSDRTGVLPLDNSYFAFYHLDSIPLSVRGRWPKFRDLGLRGLLGGPDVESQLTGLFKGKNEY